ncbi:MAG: 3-carboxy-cis,cis-muconate cycloisomerase [Flavobacteriales bacterium]|nr:3-carboxy-cis,cis-muconate cycloisomerase [Flavobacteriales bacterium]
MTASIIDSEYYGSTFGDPRVKKIFNDEGRFDSWLKTEAALARSQARVGMIPMEAAISITNAAKVENLDIKKMTEEYQKVGFPILPLVHELARCCDPESARWVHWGATTQDIIDTGLSLQMREAFIIIESQLNSLISAVAKLSQEHSTSVMPGRTFQQHAAPITFGFKTAIWLDELLRHRDRLPELRKRALVCQYGGAVGTLATLENKGLTVLKELSSELGLEEPSITWHTSRDGWAEAIFWIAMVGATLSKIANEVATLMRTEVDEIREPYESGKGGSSTMPQKRNPVACPIIMAIGNRLRGNVSSQLTAMIQEHERSVSSMPLEWLLIPESFVLLSGSFQLAIPMIEGLQVDKKQMLGNLSMGGGLLMAESVMMAIAPKVGRNSAHDIVIGAASRAWDKGITLRESLIDDERVREYLSIDEIDELIDPANYIGSSDEMIQRVLNKVSDDK